MSFCNLTCAFVKLGLADRVREPSRDEQKLYQKLCIKLEVAQMMLGRVYGALILGIGVCDLHHMACGRYWIFTCFLPHITCEKYWFVTWSTCFSPHIACEKYWLFTCTTCSLPAHFLCVYVYLSVFFYVMLTSLLFTVSSFPADCPAA